jgi:hypothetical protein
MIKTYASIPWQTNIETFGTRFFASTKRTPFGFPLSGTSKAAIVARNSLLMTELIAEIPRRRYRNTDADAA